MKKIYCNLMLAILLGSLAVLSAGPTPGGSQFVPPSIVSASNIPYPINTMAPGIVTLLVNLDAAARVQNVQALRDIPSLTGPAQTAVQSWTFAPASLNGNPVPSSLSVNVVFNPFNPGGVAIEGLAVPLPKPATPPDLSQFTPPEITSGSFAVYPINSIASGTVVLDVTIGKSGGVSKARVIRGVPSLTSPAINAVKAWGFTPAGFQGQPIAACLIVAFVFPSPALAHPA